MSRSGEMSNGQLFQQMLLLRWLSSDADEDRRVLAAVTGVRVAKELLDRITGQDQVDAFKRECILSVAEFIRQNPGASQAELNTEVEKRVVLFAARVEALQKAPIL